MKTYCTDWLHSCDKYYRCYTNLCNSVLCLLSIQTYSDVSVDSHRSFFCFFAGGVELHPRGQQLLYTVIVEDYSITRSSSAPGIIYGIPSFKFSIVTIVVSCWQDKVDLKTTLAAIPFLYSSITFLGTKSDLTQDHSISGLPSHNTYSKFIAIVILITLSQNMYLVVGFRSSNSFFKNHFSYVLLTATIIQRLCTHTGFM